MHNNGYRLISTNPFYWKLTADSVSYTPDTAIFSINQPLSQIEHGGQESFDIVYLVQGNPENVRLSYTG